MGLSEDYLEDSEKFLDFLNENQINKWIMSGDSEESNVCLQQKLFSSVTIRKSQNFKIDA
jgi:hypothetical protein